MKHKFTVVIESNDKSENREAVKEYLKDWLEIIESKYYGYKYIKKS